MRTPTLEMLVLKHWTDSKLAAAGLLGATRGGHLFLVGSQGSAEVYITENSIIPGNELSSWSINLPALFDNELSLSLMHSRQHVEFRIKQDPKHWPDLDDATLDMIVPLVMEMEIAPVPREVYGLVYGGHVVGLAYNAPIPTSSERDRWVKTRGSRFEVYMYDDYSSVFPFINDPDVALSLLSFWNMASISGEVAMGVTSVDRILKDEMVAMSAGVEGSTAWLMLSDVPRRAPFLVQDLPYWAWDAVTKGPSTTLRPGFLQQVGGPRGWFHYS